MLEFLNFLSVWHYASRDRIGRGVEIAQTRGDAVREPYTSQGSLNGGGTLVGHYAACFRDRYFLFPLPCSAKHLMHPPTRFLLYSVNPYGNNTSSSPLTLCKGGVSGRLCILVLVRRGVIRIFGCMRFEGTLREGRVTYGHNPRPSLRFTGETWCAPAWLFRLSRPSLSPLRTTPK